MKKTFWKGMITGLLLGAAFCLCLVFLLLGGWIPCFSSQPLNLLKADFKLRSIESLIEQYFLYNTDSDEMEEALYKGLLSSLGDPYSVYYTTAEYQEVARRNAGSYCGIGIQVSQNTETMEITVVTVYAGSPAFDAGIQEGDILKSVDGTELNGIELNQAVTEYIQGKEGTELSLTIFRPESGETLTYQMQRREVEVPSVEYQLLENQIGYLQILSFDTATVGQYQTAINALQESGMESLIIDLRGNGGGILDSAVKILADILPDGVLVYTEDKNGNGERFYSENGQLLYTDSWNGKRNGFPIEDTSQLDLPIAVLVNENTASAAELFAQAMKDYNWGYIIGTKTFGKGIVQSYFTLADGSAVKLTSSSYYTKSGVSIHKNGVVPDLLLSSEDDEKDLQLEEAVSCLQKIKK